jgi:hypothetical protein
MANSCGPPPSLPSDARRKSMSSIGSAAGAVRGEEEVRGGERRREEARGGERRREVRGGERR